jgi:hypothetical protein
VNPADLRSQLEDDLAWRLDEVRHLRNTLIGDIDRSSWPAAALRAILVIQYAHLEGFARNAFSLYVEAVNSQALTAEQLQPQLFASALVREFDALRLGTGGDQGPDEGRLTRRARNQSSFVARMRSHQSGPVRIEAELAVSMEMNFGADVLRRTMYMLAIPSAELDKSFDVALEFVRRMRNDIAHGSRKERIEPGMFEANISKCEQFFNDLVRLITRALTNEWFKVGTVEIV